MFQSKQNITELEKEKRLRQIADENEGADFILEVGFIRFKRKLFEDYLDTASTA